MAGRVILHFFLSGDRKSTFDKRSVGMVVDKYAISFQPEAIMFFEMFFLGNISPIRI